MCCALQEVSFRFCSYIGRLLGSIPSTSVTLIRLHDPEDVRLGNHDPDAKFGNNDPEDVRLGKIVEYEWLGLSIRKLAQRFSDHHHGLKTRVQIIPTKEEAQETFPFFMTKLEEELGTHVTLELLYAATGHFFIEKCF